MRSLAFPKERSPGCATGGLSPRPRRGATPPCGSREPCPHGVARIPPSKRARCPHAGLARARRPDVRGARSERRVPPGDGPSPVVSSARPQRKPGRQRIRAARRSPGSSSVRRASRWPSGCSSPRASRRGTRGSAPAMPRGGRSPPLGPERVPSKSHFGKRVPVDSAFVARKSIRSRWLGRFSAAGPTRRQALGGKGIPGRVAARELHREATCQAGTAPRQSPP